MRTVLWVFAAAALMATTIVACGPAPSVQCGPDTCSGCCTEEGACVGFAKQGYTQCGAEGGECRACLPGYECASPGRCMLASNDGGEEGCRPSNCAGCCGAAGCVPYSEQTGSTCGANGSSCASCGAGFACSLGGCTPSVDAGSNCGKKGEACCGGNTCYLSLTCSNGVCLTQSGGSDAGTDAGVVPDAGTPPGLPVGAACTAGNQCSTSECRIIGFPSGYCTRSCTSAGDCPSGSTCGVDPNDSSGQQKVCLATCTNAGSTSGCRSGYVCEKRVTPNGPPACVPGCNSPATCGTATTCDPRGFCCGAEGFACCNGATCDAQLTCDASGYCMGIGAACTSNSACASGNCATQADAGAAGCPTGPCWPGGYCMADCSNGAACPLGASCTPYLASTSLCVKNCESPGGQSSCRSGYVCDLNWVANTSQAVCVDACNSKADCNSTTLDCSQGFCCGKVTYRCCGGVGGSCPYSGTCGANGYCQ